MTGTGRTRRRTTSPEFGPLTSSAGPSFDAETRDRHIIAVDVLRRHAVTVLPENLPRRSAALDPIPLRKVAREVPIVIRHKQAKRCPVSTTVFFGYGPEDDREYDANGAGARDYYDAKTNEAGVKVNLTHKFAQICDLIVMLEAHSRAGDVMLEGVPVNGLLPGLYAQAVIAFGHHALHAAQYKMRPAIDPDSCRAEVVGGRASEALIEGARWERAYEEEAFAWQYAFAYTVRHELESVINVFPILRINMPELFTPTGRFALLAGGLPNDYVEYDLRDLVSNAKAHAPGSKFAFEGLQHLFMDAMVDVPLVTNALIDACDAFSSGRGSWADLENAVGRADHVWAEYFAQPDTKRLLGRRPFLQDVKPRLSHERKRARRLLGG